MANNVFTLDSVGSFYNSHFICAKIDMEKGEGPAIAKRYQVKCYPNLLFIDENGNLVHRSAGTKEGDEFIAFGQKAMDPKGNFAYFKDQFEKNPNDGKATLAYLNVISNTCLNAEADEIVRKYFAMQPEKELINQSNWNLMQAFISDYKSKEFNYVVQHQADFFAVHTVDSILDWTMDVYQKNAKQLIRNLGKNPQNLASIEELKTAVKSAHLKNEERILFGIDIPLLAAQKEWKGYESLVMEKGDKFIVGNGMVNNVAFNIAEHSENNAALNKVQGWMRKVLDDKKEGQRWYYYDTYATILFKLKLKEEAKYAAQQAIQLARRENVPAADYQVTVELLEKIEKM